MNVRPALSAVLGLLLLAQGVAVASAPLALPADGQEAPAPEAAAPQVADEMPCHGAMRVSSVPDAAPASSPDEPGRDSAPCACCDADCVAMGACAFGHIAVASAVHVSFVPAPQPAIAAPERAVPRVSVSSRLRPPIVLHA